MTHTVMAYLVVFATACAPTPSPEAGAGEIYWLETTEISVACSDVQVTHNFDNVRPTALPPVPGRSEQSRSATGDYVLVTRSADGAAFVNLQDAVLAGEELADGTLEVEWTNEAILERNTSGETYQFRQLEERRLTRTMVLEPTSDDASAYTGSLSTVEQLRLEFEETDEWPLEGFNDVSELPDIIDDYVRYVDTTASVRNFSSDDDCTGELCELGVFDECSREFVLTATLVDDDLEIFEALEDYGQTPGVL